MIEKMKLCLQLRKIDEKRKQALIQFLFSNIIKDNYLLKINAPKISNEIPLSSFTSKIGYKKEEYNKSRFILISNDIIIIPTKSIHKEKDNTEFYLSFPQINGDISLSISNVILKNDNYNNNISVIKILDKNFLFENYFEIPDDNIDIESNEKFYINEEEKEESLGIIISDNQNNNLTNDSPIYIKKMVKYF